MAVASPLVQAVEPAVMVDKDLKRFPIQIVGFSGGRLRYFGEDRNLTSADDVNMVRIDFQHPPAPPDAGLLRLSDGQQLPGQFLGVSSDGKVQWQHPQLGILEVTLEQIAGFTVKADLAALAAKNEGEPAASDIVALVNGDQLSGFVDRISTANLKLTRDDGSAMELGWDGIRAVTLANPTKPTPGVWVKLISGGFLKVDQAQIGGSRFTGVALGVKVDVPLEAVSTIDFTLRHRLVTLQSLPMKVLSGGTVFGVDWPVIFSGDSMEMHAPLSVQFELPHGTQRFAASAGLTFEARDRGDLILNISDGQGRVIQSPVNRDHPQVEINIRPRDRILVMTAEEGPGGAVLDRLVLNRAEILILDP